MGRGGTPYIEIVPRADYANGARVKMTRPRWVYVGSDLERLFADYLTHLAADKRSDDTHGAVGGHSSNTADGPRQIQIFRLNPSHPWPSSTRPPRAGWWQLDQTPYGQGVDARTRRDLPQLTECRAGSRPGRPAVVTTETLVEGNETSDSCNGRWMGRPWRVVCHGKWH